MKVLLRICFFSFVFSPILYAQVTVTALEKDRNPLEATTEVRAFRFADFEEDTEVRVGARYEIGDELIGIGTTNLELRCDAAEVSARFSGRFRVLILAPASEEVCAFSLLSGNADVLGEQNTRIESGEITLGSKSTMYGLRLERGRDGWSADCPVFEGEVVVRYLRSEPVEIGAGTNMSFQRATGVQLRRLDAEDIKRAVLLYAGMDISKAKMAGALAPQDERESFNRLASIYSRVLGNPSHLEARLQLAAEQAGHRLTAHASYHLNSAERLNDGLELVFRARDRVRIPRIRHDREAHRRAAARIALTRAVLQVQLGNTRVATQELDRAQDLDAEILNREDLRSYRIDESWIRRIRRDVEIAPSRGPR